MILVLNVPIMVLTREACDNISGLGGAQEEKAERRRRAQ